MNIDELLSEIEQVAKRYGLSKPFLVGGIPRDRVLGTRGKKSDIKDFDITTGNKDALKLAAILGKLYPDSNYRTYDDGHASVDIRGVHFDFSSNFVAPGVTKELKGSGVSDVDDMKAELYSRDFTINTLLESLDFQHIYDLTGEGIDDLKAGLLKTPIDPEITIGTDPRRILRAIKFSIKFDLKIDDKLKQAMLNHREKIKTLPTKFVQDKINEIVMLDADKGIDLLIKYKLLPLVPLTKTVSDMLIQRRQLIRAL
jgi:tRNA nucleotidyltransferase/poly(A) polymerase